MNLLEETRYRLACCTADTGDGWGEDLSLRNHLQGPVANRLAQLDPFAKEIKALPVGHELRRDSVVQFVLKEHRELTQAKMLANDYLDIAEEIAPKAEIVARSFPCLRACLRHLGIPE